jgi:hypothetical protein
VAPVIVDADKLKVVPEHIGELLPAVGAAGGGFTITAVVEFALMQPAAEVVLTV